MPCLTSAFCGHHAPWSLCHGVFTLPYSHILACSLQNPAQTRAVLMPSLSSPSGLCRREFFMLPFYIFIFPLIQVLWHEPSFLHGGLVWNYFLAYGDFLARGWVRRVGRRGQRYCCNSTGEETFLSLTCSSNLYSLPHAICSEQPFGPQVRPAVLSSPHS